MAGRAQECRRRRDGCVLFAASRKPPLVSAVVLLVCWLGPAFAFGGEAGQVVESPPSRVRTLMKTVGLGRIGRHAAPATPTNRYMEMARRMLADAHRLAQSGDVERAIQLAARADKLARISDQNTSISWFDDEEQPDEFLAQLESLHVPRPAVTQPDHICLIPSSRHNRSVANIGTKKSTDKQTVAELRHEDRAPAAASQSHSFSQAGDPADPSHRTDDATPAMLPSNLEAHDLGQARVASAADSADALNSPMSEDISNASDDALIVDLTLTSATSISGSAASHSSVTSAVMETAAQPDRTTSTVRKRSVSGPKANGLPDGVALPDPAVDPDRLIVQYQPAPGRESASWSATAFVQFVSTFVGLLFGVILYVLVRLCILRRYGADIGVILGFDVSGHEPASRSEGPGTKRELPPPGVLPFPFLTSGSTYAEKREAERKAFQQKEAAILKYVFEKNLELRDQIVQEVGSVA